MASHERVDAQRAPEKCWDVGGHALHTRARGSARVGTVFKRTGFDCAPAVDV